LDAIAAKQFGCKTGATPDLKCFCANNDKLKAAALKDDQIKSCGDSTNAKAISVATDVCACVAKG
jgi:hypothetical protein